MRDRSLRAGQRDVDRMRMAAKVVVCFKQADIGQAKELVGDRQSRNAGTNDCYARLSGCAGRRRGVTAHGQPPEDKNVAKRPDANKGGREEENRSGITLKTKRPKRLRNNETVMPQLFATSFGVSRLFSTKFPHANTPQG